MQLYPTVLADLNSWLDWAETHIHPTVFNFIKNNPGMLTLTHHQGAEETISGYDCERVSKALYLFEKEPQNQNNTDFLEIIVYAIVGRTITDKLLSAQK